GEVVTGGDVGTRVGIPWLGHTCGACFYCRTHAENLCDAPLFTGYTRDGGYAELAVADAQYCFALPDGYGDAEIAPWLCAGLIGYRARAKAGLRTKVTPYPLAQANEALDDLRSGRLTGAAVLTIGG
ncbi:MAG: alcohol dehydrogenase catalytic domain-containing protein, partial [Burkholderiales bacterium]|nr:alcohol dehydrogenase catalytic domain-containing protein [Burkholderiales bacterium]